MIQKNITLKDASDTSKTTNSPGVYILYRNGCIMKVGKAEIGIQKRMQQYYGCNSFCGLNCYINEQNRDSVTVTYQTCSKEECKELEAKLFSKYGGVAVMPWATRAPSLNSDMCKLLI